MKKIYVSDMTLRVQCDTMKKALSFRERLNIATGLEKAGVDAIELPAMTGGKEDAVICRTIASAVNCRLAIPVGDSVSSLAESWQCISAAKDPCLQVVLPISTVQMEYSYHLKAEKMLEKIASLCAAASKYCGCVEFVARDASRAEPGFAAACCKAAADNGAMAVTLCDDSGSLFPEEMAALVKDVKAACGVAVYVQPGNALNMAAACAVEALRAGADGIKTAAWGDCLSADTLADILRARGDTLGVSSKLDTTAIHNILTNLGKFPTVVAPAAPATGDVVSLDSSCTLADISGAISSLGYALTEEDTGKVYEEFRRVCAQKGKVDPKELDAIVATTAMQVPSTFHLISYVVNSGNVLTSTAHMVLEKDGQRLSGVGVGDGPIDAAFHAIEQIIGHHYELDDFQIQSVTKGREAVGSSLIRLRADGMLYSGNGVSTNIIGACVRAYINALNKIVYKG